MSIGEITNREDADSIRALELLEQGIPGAIASEEALQRGLDRRLYGATRVAAAKEAYPTKRDEWLQGACKPAVAPQAATVNSDRGYEFVVTTLNMLLGDSDKAITPENFAEYRPLIEGQLFPAAAVIGVVGLSKLVENYQGELVSSSGGPNHPSVGRLGYIKGHLQKLKRQIDNLQH